MHVAIRRWQLAPSLADELLRRVNEGFISIIKDAAGFLGYYALDDEERPGRFVLTPRPGEIVSVSIFEDRAEAEESNRKLRSRWGTT